MVKLHPRMETCKNCNRVYRIETNGWMIRHPIRFGSAFWCPEVYFGQDESRARQKELSETAYKPLNIESEAQSLQRETD